MCMSVGLYMYMCVYVYVMCKNVVGLSIKYKIILNYVKMITKLQLQNQILFMPYKLPGIFGLFLNGQQG